MKCQAGHVAELLHSPDFLSAFPRTGEMEQCDDIPEIESSLHRFILGAQMFTLVSDRVELVCKVVYCTKPALPEHFSGRIRTNCNHCYYPPLGL